MTVSQFIKDYGVFAVFISQMAWAGVAWWRRKEIPTRAELARLGGAIGEVRSQVTTLEGSTKGRFREMSALVQNLPTERQIHALSLDMERVRGDIRVYTTSMTGARETVEAQVATVEAQVTAARDLVERLENMVGTITTHLLNAK